MKITLPWRLAIRKLAAAGRSLGRFLGPFPPIEPGARFTRDFRLHASYGRFVFSMHALAPRAEALRQVEVDDAFSKSHDVWRDDQAGIRS